MQTASLDTCKAFFTAKHTQLAKEKKTNTMWKNNYASNEIISFYLISINKEGKP